MLFVFLSARRELLGSALAIGPPTIAAVLLCLGTHTLSTAHYSAASGVSEGHQLTLELIGLALVAGALRLFLGALDRRLDRVEISTRSLRRAWAISGAVAAVVVIVAAIAVDAPEPDQLTASKSFTETKSLQGSPTNCRTASPTVNNNGRLSPVGTGAGKTSRRHPLARDPARARTSRLWAKEGDEYFKVVNAHSVYFGDDERTSAPPGLIFLLVGPSSRSSSG